MSDFYDTYRDPYERPLAADRFNQLRRQLGVPEHDTETKEEAHGNDQAH